MKWKSDTAIDGDLNMDYTLILTDQQWSSTPAHSYRRQAEEALHAFLAKKVDIIGYASCV